MAAIAYVMADAGSENFAEIAAAAVGKALARMGQDVGLALKWAIESPQNYWKAFHQIDQAAKRELMLIRSLAHIESRADLCSSLHS